MVRDVSDEIEEELAPLIDAQEVKVQETYEDQINKARAASSDLSWIHVLGMSCGCSFPQLRSRREAGDF